MQIRFKPWIAVVCMGAVAACTSSGDEGAPSGNTQVNLVVNSGNIEFEAPYVDYVLACAGPGDVGPAGEPINGTYTIEGRFDVSGTDTVPEAQGGDRDVFEASFDLSVGSTCNLTMSVSDEDEVKCTGSTEIVIASGDLNLFNVEIVCDVSYQPNTGNANIEGFFEEVLGNVCESPHFVNSVDRNPEPGQFTVPVEVRATDDGTPTNSPLGAAQGGTCGGSCDCTASSALVPGSCDTTPPTELDIGLAAQCCALPTSTFDSLLALRNPPFNVPAPVVSRLIDLTVLANCSTADVPTEVCLSEVAGTCVFSVPIPVQTPVGGWPTDSTTLVPSSITADGNNGEIGPATGDKTYDCSGGAVPAAGETTPCCIFTDGDTECVKVLCDQLIDGTPRPTVCAGDNLCDGSAECPVGDECGPLSTCEGTPATCTPVVCDIPGDCENGGSCAPGSGACPPPVDLDDGTLCDLSLGSGARDGLCEAGACVACTATSCEDEFGDDIVAVDPLRECNTLSCDPASGCDIANATPGTPCGVDVGNDGTGDGQCLAPVGGISTCEPPDLVANGTGNQETRALPQGCADTNGAPVPAGCDPAAAPELNGCTAFECTLATCTTAPDCTTNSPAGQTDICAPPLGETTNRCQYVGGGGAPNAVKGCEVWVTTLLNGISLDTILTLSVDADTTPGQVATGYVVNATQAALGILGGVANVNDITIFTDFSTALPGQTTVSLNPTYAGQPLAGFLQLNTLVLSSFENGNLNEPTLLNPSDPIAPTSFPTMDVAFSGDFLLALRVTTGAGFDLIVNSDFCSYTSQDAAVTLDVSVAP